MQTHTYIATPEQAIARAIEIADGEYALAEAAGVTPNRLSMARLRGRVSPELATRIAHVTGVDRALIAPHVYGGVDSVAPDLI